MHRNRWGTAVLLKHALVWVLGSLVLTEASPAVSQGECECVVDETGLCVCQCSCEDDGDWQRAGNVLRPKETDDRVGIGGAPGIGRLQVEDEDIAIQASTFGEGRPAIRATSRQGHAVLAKGQTFGLAAEGGQGDFGGGVFGLGRDGKPGVFGTSAAGVGVEGKSRSEEGRAGVLGQSMIGPGVKGETEGSSEAFAEAAGVFGSGGDAGFGVRGESKVASRVFGESISGFGVRGESETSDGVSGHSGSGDGVSGFSASERGVSGESLDGDGVFGTSAEGAGVFGKSPQVGVKGSSTSGTGVLGESETSDGVAGITTGSEASGVLGSGPSVGVRGVSDLGIGVVGQSTSGTGLRGFSETGAALSLLSLGGDIIEAGPDFRVANNGDVFVNGMQVHSDVRVKTDLAPVTQVLERLEGIRTVSFRRTDMSKPPSGGSPRRQIGVLGQEVRAVFPELVTDWGRGDQIAVDYPGLTAVLLEAVRELLAQNVELQVRLAIVERLVLREERR